VKGGNCGARGRLKVFGGVLSIEKSKRDKKELHPVPSLNFKNAKEKHKGQVR